MAAPIFQDTAARKSGFLTGRARFAVLCAYKAIISGLLFFIPVTAAYFTAKGISDGQFITLFAVGGFTIALMEVPCGILADRWSRRGLLVVAGFINCAALLTMYAAGSFSGLLVALALDGLAIACYAGTMEALVYESLREDRPDLTGAQLDTAFRRCWSTMSTVLFVTLAVTAALGGYMYVMNVHLPVLATLGLNLLTPFLALLIREPRHHTHAVQDNRILHHIARAGRALRDIPVLFWAVAIAAITAAAGQLSMWVILAAHDGFEANYELAGLVLGADYIIRGKGSWVTRFIDHTRSGVALFLFIAILLGFGFCWAGFVEGNAVLVALLFVAWARAVIEPVSATLINAFAPQAKRATIFSLKGLADRCLYACAALFAGLGSEMIGVQNIALITGAVSVGLLTICIAGFARHTAALRQPCRDSA